MIKEISKFEGEVVNLMLMGEDAVLSALRKQFAAAQFRDREQTDAGFFTGFSFPESVEPLSDRRRYVLGGVSAEIEGLEHGAGFLLFVENGLVDCLEGFTYDEPWPAEVKNYRLARPMDLPTGLRK